MGLRKKQYVKIPHQLSALNLSIFKFYSMDSNKDMAKLPLVSLYTCSQVYECDHFSQNLWDTFS